MINVIVEDGQDLLDVCLQNYGSLSIGIEQIMKDNELNPSIPLVAGQVISINNDNIPAPKTVEVFGRKGLILCNNDENSPNNELQYGDFNTDWSLDFFS